MMFVSPDVARAALRTVASLLLLVAPVPAGVRTADAPRPSAPSARPRPIDAERAPVRVEPNLGQEDDAVAYVARGAGFTAFVTADGIVTSYHAAERARDVPERRATPSPARRFARATIRMSFDGASRAARFEPGPALPGVSNYFRGADPTRWRTNVPGFAGVRRVGLYPHTDLVVYGSRGGLEYDLVLGPGASADEIAVRLEGADAVSLDPDGSLVLSTPIGRVRHAPPVAYQESDGARRPVAARYTLGPGGRVGFEVAAHDPSRSLVIDPVLGFSTFLGGFGDDELIAVGVDAAGNVYTGGLTVSEDYPTRNPIQPGIASTDGTDAVVTKLDSSGSTLVYSTYLGGTDSENVNGVAVDAAGNVYVAGATGSVDFPTVNPFQLDTDGEGDNHFDAFVTKIAASGSALVYSTYLGGNQDDFAVAIRVDSAGQAFVAGTTRSRTFPRVSSWQRFKGLDDGFVTKFSASGSTVVYSSLFGGVNTDIVGGLAVDAAGDAYVTGTTFSAETFPVVNAFQPVQGSLSTFDAYVIKLAPSGSSAVFSTFLGGEFEDDGYGIDVDSTGAVYVTGVTESEDFPTRAPIQPNIASFRDAFVTKFDPSGRTLAYSTYLGGATDDDFANRIRVDAAGDAYVVGLTLSTDFPTVDALQADPADGTYDGFVSVINPSGSGFVYSTYFGGDDGDNVFDAALDASGALYVSGETFSDDLPLKDPVLTDTGDFHLALNGFVARIAKTAPRDTIGVYAPDSASWFLRDDNSPGPADTLFAFGAPSPDYVAIAGDWNGDGRDTPGLYDRATGTFFLRDAAASGPADVVFAFGAGGRRYLPIAGDWNGDGLTSVGLYEPATGAFFLKNANASGPADVAFVFGAGGLGYTPLSGDWNGDGVATVGLYQPSTGGFFLKYANAPGPADLSFVYGPAGSVAVVGDWDGDGRDSVGVFVASTDAWFLRDSNSSGLADAVFGFGPPSTRLTPLVGSWGGR